VRWQWCLGAVLLSVVPLIDNIVRIAAKVAAVAQSQLLGENVIRSDGLDRSAEAFVLHHLNDAQGDWTTDILIVVFDQGDIAL
jgi:hypothetical protein